MKKSSIRLDSELKDRLVSFCESNKVKMADVIRQFIAEGLDRHSQSTQQVAKEDEHYELFINEKRGIHASIEGLLLLRKLISDKEILDEVKNKADNILQDGWIREQPRS